MVPPPSISDDGKNKVKSDEKNVGKRKAFVRKDKAKDTVDLILHLIDLSRLLICEMSHVLRETIIQTSCHILLSQY